LLIFKKNVLCLHNGTLIKYYINNLFKMKILIFIFLLFVCLITQAQIIVVEPIRCNGQSNGSLIVIANHGTGPYSYEWSNSHTSQSISNLASGLYTVTITDIPSGITATESKLLTEPAPLAINSSKITNNKCFGLNHGAVEIISSGGVGVHTYNWSNGYTLANMDSLFSGTYTVTITDANNCAGIDNVTISEPPQITASSNITASNCDGHNNGAINLNVNGGISPYSFLWNEINFDSTYTSQNIDSVRGGTYALTITDQNNCIYIDTLIIPNNNFVEINVSSTPHVCNGLHGSVSMRAVLADSAYYFTYSWSSQFNTGGFTTNDSVFAASTSFLAGSYTLTITDETSLCAAYHDFTITESETPLTVSSLVRHNKCFDDLTGYIVLYPTGGEPLPGYTASWTGPNGYTSAGMGIYNLAIGDYNYTVRDGNVCVYYGSQKILPETPLQGYIGSTDLTCDNYNNGTMIANYSGGTGNISYNWSNGYNSPYIINLPSGVYSLTVTDEAGCEIIDSASVNMPLSVIECLVIPNVVTANGDGYNDVFSISGACDVNEIYVVIFNDAGQQVFETTDCSFYWNPLDYHAPANSVFYYYIKIIDNGKVYEYKSSIDVKI